MWLTRVWLLAGALAGAETAALAGPAIVRAIPPANAAPEMTTARRFEIPI
jgi:hypothetical protein